MRDFDKNDGIDTPEGYRNLGDKLVIGQKGGYDSLATVLNMELQKQSDILIIGGGGGKEISTLQKYSDTWNFTVIDPSGKMLKFAEYWIEKENVGQKTKLLKGYLSDFDFKESSFDAITCMAVFHYIEKSDRQDILNQIKKVLKPNGLFIWSVAVKPDTEKDFDYFKRMYRQFPTQNGIESNMVDNIIHTLENDYKMLTSKEEFEMIKESGFKDRIEIFSSLFFKTYVVGYSGHIDPHSGILTPLEVLFQRTGVV
jgi:tRNA (cmo5U34)-methyltransferase